MYVVICYDVEDDRRRTRLHKHLASYGVPVQKSVFECDLDRGRLARALEGAARIINRKTDSLRCYPLCAACRAGIVAFGYSESAGPVQVVVV
jgi:CRISPR-associated protein Cas2